MQIVAAFFSRAYRAAVQVLPERRGDASLVSDILIWPPAFPAIRLEDKQLGRFGDADGSAEYGAPGLFQVKQDGGGTNPDVVAGGVWAGVLRAGGGLVRQ